MAIDARQAAQVWQEADLLHSAGDVEAAVSRMAAEITERLGERDPVVLPVMNGGLIPAGMLLPQLLFPLRLDYLHATRYREQTSGADLLWQRTPESDLAGRYVLVVDDILDEGHTLQRVVEHCQAAGAAEVLSAVLVEKRHDRGTGFQADFVGLEVEDRYVFGSGMDYKGYLRNVPGIHAVKGM